MTFNSIFAVLLAMLALGAALVTQAAGRPWGSWADTHTIQNIQEEGEEEGVTIPSFLLNYTSPLDAENIRQYAALWENHTLGQHSEAFCRNANLVCNSNINVDDPPHMNISMDELDDGQLFLDAGEPYADEQALEFGERDFMEGKEIVLPESLYDVSENPSPAFLPDFLAKKMPLSSEKVHELLDTFHILQDSKLANMMFRTINHCEVVKEKTSKEIEVTEEKEIEEKGVMVSKEKEFEGKETVHKGKERKEKEIEFSKVKVKKSKVVEEQEEENEFILNKEKQIEQSNEQSITKEVKKKNIENGKMKEAKKEIVQSKEKKTKEEQIKKREVEHSKVKETIGKESKRKEIEKCIEKDIKENSNEEREFKVKEIYPKMENEMKKKEVHAKKEKSNEEKKGKDKEIEYKKKEVKEKEKKVKEEKFEYNKGMKEKDFYIHEEKASEVEKVKEKEFAHKKKTELRKLDIHRSEEKSSEEKIVKEKEIIYKEEKEGKEKDFHITEEKENEVEKSQELKPKNKDVYGSEEKTKLLKEIGIEYDKEKERKGKDTYIKKEESSKEISKCVTSLEGMTSFVKKSLPKQKHIKALERSTSNKLVEKEQKKLKWKVLVLKKYEKAVVCKSNIFLFAVYKCHDISKIESKFIYHIELEDMDGIHRQEILACKGKKQSVDSKIRKAKSTSTIEVSCQWVTNSLVWASDI